MTPLVTYVLRIATVSLLAGLILFLVICSNAGLSWVQQATGTPDEDGSQKQQLHQAEVFRDSIWDSNRLLSNSKYHQPDQNCLTGQGIQNLPPICGNPTCLPDIVVPSSNKPIHVNVTAADIELIKNTRFNNMDISQVNVVNMLTDIQWSRGIYGTVGEIGLYRGKYSMALARHTDTDHGERFFACDIFDKLGQGYVELNMKNQVNDQKWVEVRREFLKNLKTVGFSPDNEDVTKRLYFWYDSSIYLSKNSFLEMGLPSVRLMSIDGYHYGVAIWYELIQTMCVLRNGGIIVLDDINSKYADTVTTALNDFHRMVSSKIVSPLILNVNKLYVTSSEWHAIYIKDIEEALKIRTDINLKKETFVEQFTRNNLTYFLRLN